MCEREKEKKRCSIEGFWKFKVRRSFQVLELELMVWKIFNFISTLVGVNSLTILFIVMRNDEESEILHPTLSEPKKKHWRLFQCHNGD